MALPGYGQAGRPAGGVSGPRLLKIIAAPAHDESSQRGAVQGEVVREIDDPNSGERWLLVRDSQQPGGPGHLLQAGQMQADEARGGQVQLQTLQREPDGAARQTAAAPAELKFLPVIRTGDRLVVEEHTPVVDAVLEARALHPAAPGAVFEARLSIGGRVVRVVALGPGRAELEAETGGRP
jgi:hypothetical protein